MDEIKRFRALFGGVVGLGLATWCIVNGVLRFRHPHWEEGIYWVAGILSALFFYASLMLHELGHAAAARRNGIEVERIALSPWGGATILSREPATPRAEVIIALAGPLANLGLALIFAAIAALAGTNPELSAIASYLCATNLTLAIFNLLPAWPLDGGRLVRAILWRSSGDVQRANRATGSWTAIVAITCLIAGMGWIALSQVALGVWPLSVGLYLTAAQIFS